MNTRTPSDRDLLIALRIVAGAVGEASAWVDAEGRFFYRVGPDGWVLGVSADDAGRFRLVAFYGSTEVATLWCLAADRGRLADLALAFRREVAAYGRA